jgi:hypothetical protein
MTKIIIGSSNLTQLLFYPDFILDNIGGVSYAPFQQHFHVRSVEYTADWFMPVNGFPTFRVQPFFQIRT